jgi:tRNA U34 5-carboxymethylaminomethyl modifying enzyme MnmG/GidA
MQSRTVEFNLRIEQLKIDHNFETYLETLSYFIDNETDQEPEQIAKLLNKKIVEELSKEASKQGFLKNIEETISLL